MFKEKSKFSAEGGNKPENKGVKVERFKSKIEFLFTGESGPNKSRGKLEDLIIIEGNKRVSLKTLIPEGVRLVPSYVFLYNHEDKTVVFDRLKLDSLGGRLGLLHEIGHAKDLSENPDVIRDWNRVRNIWEKIQKTRATMTGSKQNLFELIKNSGILPDELSKLVKVMVRNERIAWANALKLYRQIKKEYGIDFLDGANYKEIINMLEGPLSLGGFDELFHQLMPEQQAKLFFVKKFGEKGAGKT